MHHWFGGLQRSGIGWQEMTIVVDSCRPFSNEYSYHYQSHHDDDGHQLSHIVVVLRRDSIPIKAKECGSPANMVQK